jgi:poly-gamma-glutamate synthesis protein (capsule biosynthesis protein)
MFLALGPAKADTLPPFRASVGAMGAERQAKMAGVSWQPNCPVVPAGVVSVRMTHLLDDGAVREGQLVVHKRMAPEVVSIFRGL